MIMHNAKTLTHHIVINKPRHESYVKTELKTNTLTEKFDSTPLTNRHIHSETLNHQELAEIATRFNQS